MFRCDGAREEAMMQTRGMDELMGQLRGLEALAAGKQLSPAQGAPAGGVDFAAELAAALGRVDASKQSALALARQFETGRGEVQLHEVMLSMQKANIAFQGVVQVRNRLVSAYQDIMNMQI
jgi:flagellar hook-basal body complex protein FliE